jgi:hypothetical protein
MTNEEFNICILRKRSVSYIAFRLSKPKKIYKELDEWTLCANG